MRAVTDAQELADKSTRAFELRILRENWLSLHDDVRFMYPALWKQNEMSQLMRLWYLSHRRPAKAQASLRIRADSPEPSLFAHMKFGSRQSVRPKIRHLVPLDGCACAIEERVYGGQRMP